MKENFTSHDCSDAIGSGESNFYGQYYDNNYHGSVLCDIPKGYDTGVSGTTIKLYTVDENKQKIAEATYVTIEDGVVYNMIPGVTYRWEEVGKESTVYGFVQTEGRRTIKAGSTRNIRDLGGLAVSNSNGTGTIKYGRLYRGAKLEGNNIVADLQKLGVTKEIDLRNNGEGTQNSDPKFSDRIIAPFIHYEVDLSASQDKAVVADVIQKLLDSENVYFHCRVGADRTGTLAYILEGLLGVSDEDRKQDYELTTLFGLTDRTRYYAQKNSSSQSNKTHKFVYMTESTRIPTTESIYNWFTDDGTDATAVQLVSSLRTAMVDYN